MRILIAYNDTPSSQKALELAMYHSSIINENIKIYVITSLEDSKSEKDIQTHHFDYTNPLRIIWICGKCHAVLHGHKLYNRPLVSNKKIKRKKAPQSTQLYSAKEIKEMALRIPQNFIIKEIADHYSISMRQAKKIKDYINLAIDTS